MKSSRSGRLVLAAGSFAILAAAALGIVTLHADAGSRAAKAKGTPNTAAAAGNEAATPAPLFDLPTTDGKTVKLNDYKGKVVLVDFWATWCPPCRRGIPDLMSLYDQYKDKGLVVVGLSVDRAGMSTVKKFASANKINYPIALCDAKTQGAYGGIAAIPTAFLIDQKGNIRKMYRGLHPKEELEKDVQSLLAEA